MLFCFLSLLLAVVAIFSTLRTSGKLRASDELDLDVKEFCLIDANTGTVLAEKNSIDRR